MADGTSPIEELQAELVHLREAITSRAEQDRAEFGFLRGALMNLCEILEEFVRDARPERTRAAVVYLPDRRARSLRA